jgi:hypothetical protein
VLESANAAASAIAVGFIGCLRFCLDRRQPHHHQQNPSPWLDHFGRVGFDALLYYFVITRLTGGGGAAAGEIANVNQVFQPAGRAELPNSP